LVIDCNTGLVHRSQAAVGADLYICQATCTPVSDGSKAGRTLLLDCLLDHLCQYLPAFFSRPFQLYLLVSTQLFASSSYWALFNVSNKSLKDGSFAAGIKQAAARGCHR